MENRDAIAYIQAGLAALETADWQDARQAFETSLHIQDSAERQLA